MRNYETSAVPPRGYCNYCSNPEAGFYVTHLGYCPKLHEVFTQREQEKQIFGNVWNNDIDALYDNL